MPRGISKNPEVTRNKMSKRMLGNKFRLGKQSWSKGLTKKTDKRIANSSKILKEKGIRPPKKTEFKKGHKPKGNYFKKGNKHWNWRGGKSTIIHRIRNSKEYKLWRESIFKRDNYTCIWCGKRGGKLHADHIKPFALFPELRFAIDNGRTLCVECHKKTYSYQNNKITLNNYKSKNRFV